MQRVAIFVDAGYFWVQACSLVLGSRGARGDITLDYAKLCEAFIKEISEQFCGISLLRIYWYDGPGPQGKTADHHAIDDLDDFKLRMGTRNGAGQQKAVDGLIIADMVSLTQSKAITDSLLVTGDADLTPGVVAAQSMGLRVHLLTIGTSNATSPHLAAEVDRKVTWHQAVVSSFAKRATPAPTIAQQATVPSAAGAAVTAAAVGTVAAPAGAATVAAVAATGGVGSTVATPTTAPFDPISAAQSAYASISSGSNAAMLSGISKSQALPHEIDKELLAAGRKQIGRSLEEGEKRSLRIEFKKLA